MSLRQNLVSPNSARSVDSDRVNDTTILHIHTTIDNPHQYNTIYHDTPIKQYKKPYPRTIVWWSTLLLCSIILTVFYFSPAIQYTDHQSYALYADSLLSSIHSITNKPVSLQLSTAQCNLYEFARKLIDRQPVELGILGGSISKYGWYGQYILDYMNEHYPAVDRLTNQTISHRISNRAINGIGSHTYSLCFNDFYPADTMLPDLILIDFAVNDHLSLVSSNNDGARTIQNHNQSDIINLSPASNIERITRNILSHNKLIQLNDTVSTPTNNQLQCNIHSDQQLHSTALMMVYFTRLNLIDVQSQHQQVAEYYDIPDVSFHNLVEHWPIPQHIYDGTDINITALFLDDTIHPSHYSHYIVAQQLIHTIQHSINQLKHNNKLYCELCSQLYTGQSIQQILPVPLYPGNQHSTFVCNLGDTMPSNVYVWDKSIDFQPVQHRSFFDIGYNHGWQYIDEIPDRQKKKIGFISTVPGSLISIGIVELQHTLILSYLRSYDNIGVAELFITAGKYNDQLDQLNPTNQLQRSESMTIDALYTEWPVSTYELIVYNDFTHVIDYCHTNNMVPYMNIRLLDINKMTNTTNHRINKFKFIGYFVN